MPSSRSQFVAWLNIAAAFAAGATLAWLGAQGARRLRSGSGPISDDIVLQRVRSRVAEVVSRPDAVEVTVENGVVRLAGEVPAEERDELLTQLLYMPGVVRLRNALGTM